MNPEDRELFDHYLRRGGELRSMEAAWLDYELRSFVLSRLPARRPLEVCNVGIGAGAGLWDDWLGHILGAPITSVDRDPDVCRLFAHRQRRERHPFPARVICGDVGAGVLGVARFDVITVVGPSDGGRTRRALEDALVPGGQLLIAETGEGAGADRVRTRGDTWLACSTRTR